MTSSKKAKKRNSIKLYLTKKEYKKAIAIKKYGGSINKRKKNSKSKKMRFIIKV